jgi:hypothetical protein
VLLRWLPALALAAGCSDPDCFVGDRLQAPVLQVTALDAEGAPAAVGDGAALALIRPPQTGRILAVGLRARNVCAGPIQVTGAIIDPCTGRVAGLEGRTVRFVAAGDGFAEPAEPAQLASYANVAVCPNQGGDRDIDGQRYRLTMSLKDGQGHVASTSLEVTPVCAQPENGAECRCICAAGYQLGQVCPAAIPDAGVMGCPADAG